jgi:4-carboxymuconolactone decarboxylase
MPRGEIAAMRRVENPRNGVALRARAPHPRRANGGTTMSDDSALFDKGLPIRRSVLGSDYVDRSLGSADDFMMGIQRAATAWGWGWAWGDPTLDRRTRSMINLAMLTALGRPHELKLHVKGALNNGITVEEIKAALLHATAYCGIPAGLDAFKAAHEVLVKEGAIPAKDPAKHPA